MKASSSCPIDPTIWVGGLALFLAVVVTYLPIWPAGYIWDDRTYLVHNPALIGLGGLWQIWTTHAADIGPLTYTTFWCEHALWGFVPLPYHIVNVLMHGLCAVALWRVLQGLQVPGAWLGAALWALHPMQVESVAWIMELKNTQSGLFFLISIWFFIKYLRVAGDKRSSGNTAYAFSLFFATLAMASKSSTVILPLVLGLIAWWIDARWSWKRIPQLVPYFVLAAVASAVSIWTQRLQGSVTSDAHWTRTWPERLAGAGYDVWFYLGKLLWPYPQMTIYPRWEIDAAQIGSYLPLVGVMALLALFWWKRNAWARPWFLVFAYFLVALLPVLGLVDNVIFYSSLVFDHFQYLAAMGPLALAGAGIAGLAARIMPGKPAWQWMAVAVLPLVLAVVSWQRVGVYENDGTLWRDTLAKNQDAWAAHFGLGWYLVNTGHPNEAIVECRKALALAPDFFDAHNTLGIALAQTGQANEAIGEFQTAIRDKPDNAETYANLGLALEMTGQLDPAEAACRQALALDPGNPDAYNNLGVVLLQKNQPSQAAACFAQALRLQPNFPSARENLAKALAAQQNAGSAP